MARDAKKEQPSLFYEFPNWRLIGVMTVLIIFSIEVMMPLFFGIENMVLAVVLSSLWCIPFLILDTVGTLYKYSAFFTEHPEHRRRCLRLQLIRFGVLFALLLFLAAIVRLTGYQAGDR